MVKVFFLIEHELDADGQGVDVLPDVVGETFHLVETRGVLLHELTHVYQLSPLGIGGYDDERLEPLKYCTKVKYLDIGHNGIETLDFLYYMPDLEVVILAIEQPTDLSAFANCPNLEYAELFNGHVTDVSPLANCKHLKHLNLCMNQITDITPLYGLDELERFWISRNRELPKEQIEKFKELHPNCVVNTTTVDPTDPPWRYKANGEKSKRYALLRAQMGYNRDLIYSLVEPDKNN